MRRMRPVTNLEAKLLERGPNVFSKCCGGTSCVNLGANPIGGLSFPPGELIFKENLSLQGKPELF